MNHPKSITKTESNSFLSVLSQASKKKANGATCDNEDDITINGSSSRDIKTPLQVE